MSALTAISKFLFGDWSEVYITTNDDDYEALITILETHHIKYKVTIRKPTKENVHHKNNAYYISVLSKDYDLAHDLFAKR